MTLCTLVKCYRQISYSLDEQRKKTLNKLTELQSLILLLTNSTDAIAETTKHISNAVGVLKVLDKQTPPPLPANVRKRPANALPDKQFRYKSIKNKSSSVSLHKPSYQEVQNSKQKLNEVDVIKFVQSASNKMTVNIKMMLTGYSVVCVCRGFMFLVRK